MACRVLVIGHSHVVAIKAGHEKLASENPRLLAGFEFRFVNLLNPEIGFPPIQSGDPASLPEAYVSHFESFRPDVTVMAVKGNEHNVLALVEHPRKFDFILPEQPGLPLDRSREILPYDVINSVMQRQVRWVRLLLGATRLLATGRLLVLESPPPVPSEDHIRAHPETFYEMLRKSGVAPASLRYKVWRTQSLLLRSLCKKLGIAFRGAPGGALDDTGMLAEPAWSNDATHGNAWYGSLVVRQIIGFAGSKESAGGSVA